MQKIGSLCLVVALVVTSFLTTAVHATEGDYISSFDTAACGNTLLYALGTDGTNIWVTDGIDDEVYKYTMDGTYVSSFDTAACGNGLPTGLGTDGTNIWVADFDDDEVYKYTMDGTYVSSFDTAACGNGDHLGLGTDGTNIWVTDFGDTEVYKYTMDGTYVSSFDTVACGNAFPTGLGTDGTNIWVADLDDAEVYKYTMDGTYVSSFDTHAYGNDNTYGVGTDGTNIWVGDNVDSEVYKYEGPAGIISNPVPANESEISYTGDGTDTCVDINWTNFTELSESNLGTGELFNNYSTGEDARSSIQNGLIFGQEFNLSDPIVFTKCGVKVGSATAMLDDANLYFDLYRCGDDYLPYGESLSSSYLLNTSIPYKTYSWVYVNFTPVSLTPGKYALILTYSGPGISEVGWSRDDDAGYSDGRSIYNGGFWDVQSHDQYFKIYGWSLGNNISWDHVLNLTYLSNSSGSWATYGINYAAENGTYCVFNENFTELGTYYWNVTATSNGTDIDEEVYHFTIIMPREIGRGAQGSSILPRGLEDIDNDGLTYDDELIYGTNSMLPDTDFDGYLDGAEILAATNPLDASSNPGTQGTPGFEVFILVVALGAYLLIKRKRSM